MQIFIKGFPILLVFTFFCLSDLRASDTLTGANLLRYLYEKSSRIISTSKAELRQDVPQGTRAVVYRVTVQEWVKDKAIDSELNIVVPRSEVFKSNDVFVGAVVFLIPLDKKDIPYWWKEAAKPDWLANAWVVVGGKEGVIPKEAPGKTSSLSQIRSYVEAKQSGKTENLISWAEQASAESASAFVQQSAVEAIGHLARELELETSLRQKTVAIFDRTLKSDKIDTATKQIALSAYRFTETDFRKTATKLHAFASDTLNPIHLREFASRETSAAFTDLVESQWQQTTKVIGNYLPKKSLPEITTAELQNLNTTLNSTDSKDRVGRLGALHTVALYQYSEALADMIEKVVRIDKDEVVQVAAVKVLAGWKNEKEAAKRLYNLAIDIKQTEPIKHACVMGLGMMDKAAAQFYLLKLADELPENSKYKLMAKSFSRQK